MNWNNRTEVQKYLHQIVRETAHKRLGVLGFLLESVIQQALYETTLENLLAGQISIDEARRFLNKEYERNCK